MITKIRAMNLLPERFEKYFEHPLYLLELGAILWVLSVVTEYMPLLPWFLTAVDEVLLFVGAIAIGLVAQGHKVALFRLMIVFWGYAIIPNIGYSSAAYATMDSLTGTLQKSYLDEAKGGAETRRIFIIQDHKTCGVSQYVSKDAIVFVLGLWPVVYHTTSQATRDTLLTLEGQSVRIKDVHDRRGARDMPIFGVAGGWITGLFGVDWTSFPNIYEAKKSNALNPCK